MSTQAVAKTGNKPECAAVVQQYSKAGIFQALLDWTTVADDDLCIKHHPQFHKTVNYRHLTSSGDTEHTASGRADAEATASMSPSCDILMSRFIANNQDPAVAKHVLSTMTREPVSPLATLFNKVLVTPSPTTPLEPLTPLCPSTAASPSKEHLRAMGNRTQPKTIGQHGKRKDRQTEDYVVDETDHKASSSTAHAVAGPVKAMSSNTVNDIGFWDVDTRPAGWGCDSTIATLAECDKCIKLDIPCIVLPDKKYGFTRLDGVGVQARL
ncbi:uncharacterized protein F5147DRAFT_652931 [Suillus discolor]|uniref:Uncharacterized protein n=1 Tax=Suillus discolor TaxID=1912936 RepID=A0A9P7F832_9AGAM|nr:uncharacterized protein F5147DRAFT_652931 [Suillus discolor]KAG2108210.1 hypothetical protein F5147DRAFT_652931 [Suillus discolor]